MFILRMTKENVLTKNLTRRKALSTAGKVAVGVVAAGVIGGLGGYYAGSMAAAPATVKETVTVGAATVTVPTTITQTRTVEVVKGLKVVMGMVLAGYVEGSTWDGRQIKAVERLKQLYPWFDYVYDEGVVLKGKDPISSARDLIKVSGANIVFGSWEPAAIPAFHTIADEYPDVYFLGIVGSDISSRRNFIRVFIRQYQAMYLEGLVAGAITQTNKIGIAVGPACVQNWRRMAAFYLGIKEANPNATLYIKYVGEWYDPPKEREVSHALVDLGVDVLTHYTDSVEPLKVAEERGIWFVGKDADIVGLYGWGTTDTVAVSFDTRWEVLFYHILKEYLAGTRYPDRIVFLGMNHHIPLPSDNPWVPGQTILPAVDLQNDNKIGLDAISPKAKRLISEDMLKLIERRRNQMLLGAFDPFCEYALVSSGEGVPIPELGLEVPPKGTVVKPAGVMPTDDWLLGKLNFQLDGIVLVK
ncbi:MAG: BMP family ABC transporter substrate-binding protein [Nitrososphaerota archaeon]